MKKILFAVITVLALVPLVSYAKSPFGLKWETPKVDLLGEVIREDGISVIVELYVPKPNSIYKDYAGYTNDNGLYAVSANTHFIKDDYFGEVGKKQFYNVIRFLEKSGYNKTNALIKSTESKSGFYECINQSGCNFYMWVGVDKDGDRASASIKSLGNDSGYISVQYVKKGLSIHGF
ncbi:hypothetical protein [Vibrio rotiferianus]|uniref:hypothetical protein n=1 Tax=Vibrio rotiferianus TaxID=190895 RepID=UPI0011109BB9|nr:hypothetical protein [Vibrio rotiferianus]TMX60963.1 hypothetical protein DA097_17100 [Vibrio rotiferianus]